MRWSLIDLLNGMISQRKNSTIRLSALIFFFFSFFCGTFPSIYSFISFTHTHTHTRAYICIPHTYIRLFCVWTHSNDDIFMYNILRSPSLLSIPLLPALLVIFLFVYIFCIRKSQFGSLVMVKILVFQINYNCVLSSIPNGCDLLLSIVT